MSATLLRLAGTGLICALTTPASAQLLTHKDLSYPLAKTIAEVALENCGSRGYAVSAVVVDRAGEVMIAMRASDASPHTMENARRKAYTARTFKRPTADYAKQWQSGNPVIRQQATLPHIIAIPGGVPIKVGDEVIGGIGVSGSPGVDDECVQAGLAKVADQLK